MSSTLLILKQLDPLDNIPISAITSAEKVGDKLKLCFTNDLGRRVSRDIEATEFVLTQCRECGIEIQEA